MNVFVKVGKRLLYYMGAGIFIWSILLMPFDLDSFEHGIISIPLFGSLIIFVLIWSAGYIEKYYNNNKLAYWLARLPLVVAVVMGISQAKYLRFPVWLGIIMGLVFLFFLKQLMKFMTIYNQEN